MDETQSALELERKRTLGQMLTKEEHADMMEKVGRVAELTKVNKELAKQKAELNKSNEAIQMKVGGCLFPIQARYFPNHQPLINSKAPLKGSEHFTEHRSAFVEGKC